MTVDFAKSDLIFDIAITVYHGEESAFARIVDYHTMWSASARGTRCCCPRRSPARPRAPWPTSPCSPSKHLQLCNEVRIEDVKEVLDRQISYNMAIAEEGLRGDYGANIGKVLLKTYGDTDVKVLAKAYAAAGSDAG